MSIVYISIPWCIYNSAALLLQFLRHKLNMPLFVNRYGEKVILSSHKLSLCSEVNDWVGVSPTSLVSIVFDGSTVTITIKHYSCFTIMLYGKVSIGRCNGTIAVTPFP